jgi:enoyl-CoA hydratase/carnithine racemase
MSSQAMGSQDCLSVERLPGDPVALVTLRRPQVQNALNTEMGRRLAEAFSALSADAGVRCVVLTGEGDRAFCAGGDLKERLGLTTQQWMVQHRIFEKAFAAIRRCRSPVIAAVNGLAVGGGCELVLSADFATCAEGAQFGQPEVRLGIMPGCGGTQLLPRRLPPGLACELLMTGGTIGSDLALRHGLVNHVFGAADLLRETLAIARQISGNSPAAVSQVKQAVWSGAGHPVEAALDIELALYGALADSADRVIGVTAFSERRKPEFPDAVRPPDA